MVVLLVIILILLIVLICQLKQLSDDLWDFQCNSDMQYAELLDTIDDCLKQESEILKTIQEWSEKNG